MSSNAKSAKVTSLKSAVPSPAEAEALENILKAGQEAASRQFESTVKATAEQMEKTTRKLVQTSEEIAGLGRDTLDAVTQATTSFAKGYEEIGRNMMGWAQSAVEQAMNTGKQMLTVKTLRELVDLQAAFMKGWVDSSMAETTRLSEISTRTTTQALEPITQHVNATVERMAQAAGSADKAA